ncbi:MAG: DUF4003 family protein [Oscillospiraceae bacterium]|nr:DUF4003 family protein [Oscillospiraceae bacterium]
MRESLQSRTKLFVENRQKIKSAFILENIYMYPLSAFMYAQRGLDADVSAIKNSADLIRQKTGLFSNFRGTSKLAVATVMSLTEDPKSRIDRMLSIYNKLRKVFPGSEYLTVAALVISDITDEQIEDQLIMRTKSLYNMMKKNHPLVTSGDDYTLAALLAKSDTDDITIMEMSEKCFDILKKEFLSSNAVAALSNVITLGGTRMQENCQRAIDIFEGLKARGIKYGTGFELPALGVLSILDIDIDSIIEDICETDEVLKKENGFGALGIGSRQRIMYCAALAMCDYYPSSQLMSAAAINSVVSVNIANQIAIYSSMAAASAASAAAY